MAGGQRDDSNMPTQWGKPLAMMAKTPARPGGTMESNKASAIVTMPSALCLVTTHQHKDGNEHCQHDKGKACATSDIDEPSMAALGTHEEVPLLVMLYNIAGTCIVSSVLPLCWYITRQEQSLGSRTKILGEGSGGEQHLIACSRKDTHLTASHPTV